MLTREEKAKITCKRLNDEVKEITFEISQYDETQNAVAIMTTGTLTKEIECNIYDVVLRDMNAKMFASKINGPFVLVFFKGE